MMENCGWGNEKSLNNFWFTRNNLDKYGPVLETGVNHTSVITHWKNKLNPLAVFVLSSLLGKTRVHVKYSIS
jgi:hypothetical protein